MEHLQLAWEDEDEPPENDPDEVRSGQADSRNSRGPRDGCSDRRGPADGDRLLRKRTSSEGSSATRMASSVVHGNAFASGVNNLIDKHFGRPAKNAVHQYDPPQFPLVIFVDPAVRHRAQEQGVGRRSSVRELVPSL